MIQVQDFDLDSDTIERLRLVDDTILSYGSILNIPITKYLLESAKLAYSRYGADLAAKRRLLDQAYKIEKQK